MATEAEIHVKGMQALIGALDSVDAERFMAAPSPAPAGRMTTEGLGSFLRRFIKYVSSPALYPQLFHPELSKPRAKPMHIICRLV